MEEVIELFNRNRVRYLLIGGQAVRLEGMPRFSMDWDFYLPPKDNENLAKINDLLKDRLDTPLVPLGERGEHFVQTYQLASGIIQFHLGGPGLPPFEEADERAVTHQTEQGTPVRCMHGDDLAASKRAAGRPQDLLDAEFLDAKKKGRS